MLLLGWSK